MAAIEWLADSRARAGAADVADPADAADAAGAGLEHALSLAAQQQRPLFLYWGARWCPPCNRVKAEIFASAEVQRRLSQVLAYQLDGDSAGAQALAARLRLRSYPTLVLFAPDGGEITRLPCELDGEGFAAAFDAALSVWRAGSSAASALQAAQSGVRALSADEWTLLSHYCWDTDEGALLRGADEAVVLQTLHQRAAAQAAQPVQVAQPGQVPAEAAQAAQAASPAGAISDAAARLGLFAQLAAAGRQGAQPDGTTFPDAASKANDLLSLFTDARLARANMDMLVNSAINLIKFATRREELVAALSRQAAAWADDFWMNAIDRLLALRLQMRLARLVAPA